MKTLSNSKSFAQFASIGRLCKTQNSEAVNIIIDNNSQKLLEEIKAIRTTEEDINLIRDNIYNLSSKLEKTISMRLDQEILEPQAIAALVKLVDSFLKLVEVEYTIADGKNVEKPADTPAEDQELLKLYKSEIMAPRAGFEPATERLTAACSTTELPRNNACE